MSEEPVETYRGVPIYYTVKDGFPLYTATYRGRHYGSERLPAVYEWIDDVTGRPEYAAPTERPAEVYVEDYRGCGVYALTETGLYYSLCAPEVKGSMSQVHDAIDAYLETVEREEEEVPEVVEEEEPEIPLVVVEAPALPFYASWLKPFVEYIGNLVASVVNHAEIKLAPLRKGLDAIVTLPTTLMDGLNEALPGLFQKGRNKGADIAAFTLREVLSGTEPWMEDLGGSLESVKESTLGNLDAAVTEGLGATVDGDLNASVEALEAMKAKILNVAIANFALHAIMESGSLGQFEFMKEIDPMVIQKYGLDEVVRRATLLPIEKAVLTPAEQAYNRAYPNVIPTASELIGMVVKEVIPLDRFKAEMLKLGFREEWSQAIWDAHYIPPDYTQIREALYRGVIDREQFESLKRLVDLDPRFDTIWDGLVEQIPPFSELVNQRVKEVIDEDEFRRLLQWYGMDPIQADRIWAAHFIPPTLGDLLTAWRRGVITTERLDELMVIVDLDPRFKEIFDTRRYVDPSITMARFMFETGAIGEARVREIVLRNGYREDDAEDIVHWIISFQERRFRTSYLRSLATGAVYDAFTDDEVVEAVTDAGYTEEVAHWLLESAEAREATAVAKTKEPAPKLMNLGDLKSAYRKDLIDEDGFRSYLMTLGYEVGEVDLLTRLLNEERVEREAGGRKVALSQTELLNAWRYDEVTEDYVRIELGLRGMETGDIDILLKTKKKQWGLE